MRQKKRCPEKSRVWKCHNKWNRIISLEVAKLKDCIVACSTATVTKRDNKVYYSIRDPLIGGDVLDVVPYLNLLAEQYQMLRSEEDQLDRLVNDVLSKTDSLPEEEMENVVAAMMPFEVRHGKTDE